MCEVVEPLEHYEHEGMVFNKGEVERKSIILEDGDIFLTDLFYKANGVLYCKHPDTDWHLMEVPRGKALHCPAHTRLKVVLPRPFDREKLNA